MSFDRPPTTHQKSQGGWAATVVKPHRRLVERSLGKMENSQTRRPFSLLPSWICHAACARCVLILNFGFTNDTKIDSIKNSQC